MPLNFSREDRRLLLVLGAIFLTTLLLALLFTPSKDIQAKVATTYSAASEGTKAAYLLLLESGYNCERWERSPSDLKSENTTLLINDPSVAPSRDDQQAVTKFVSEGGTLILSGALGSLFLTESAPVAEPLGVSGWQTFNALTPSAAARQAPQIRMQAAAYWTHQATAGIALYGDSGRNVVMQYAIGTGQVVWVASSSVLSNAGLRESGNLEFLLAIVGDRQHRVLWDEYFHGHRTEKASGVSHPQMKWLFVQLAVLAAAVLGTYSRRSGPQRAPAAVSRLSPLEFVQALGELYSNAHAANVAVDIYYGRFRYWSAKRLGLPINASPEEVARAFEQRRGLSDPEFLVLLKTCESARFYSDLPRREALDLFQRLYHYANKLQLFPALGQEKN
jgi:hypothetical protein